MIVSGILLFRQLNVLADTRDAFNSEKKTVFLTMIFFCLSFLVRLLIASLNLGGIYVSHDVTEVPAVQL